ncbi:hypothetical protein [Pseudobacteriovorax antillogorgiicola]|uniref:Low affinity Fe/Cu permease n=1 Tax=Pseudobacteriovorax antillogorgiicola TaxID=1513793 RepID=A0A1Y6C636_9BACT|nr:hypothetical protein [Pseudobacteriovorax antillogorgiicola]TCS49368.1 hypothetical protein EDD56_11548 [Pseudobacteriovorax antillogorgiicola]SMF47453.1 hypothetical protein SAMN06296036_114136 [Pseudobacteriovorax antillogorgiicola]
MLDSKSFSLRSWLLSYYLEIIVISVCVAGVAPSQTLSEKLLVFIATIGASTLCFLVYHLWITAQSLETELERLRERLRIEVLENERRKDELRESMRLIPASELEKYENVIPIYSKQSDLKRRAP